MGNDFFAWLFVMQSDSLILRIGSKRAYFEYFYFGLYYFRCCKQVNLFHKLSTIWLLIT